MQFNMDTHKRQNPFTVPEGYFDNLTDRIMAQIPEAAPVKKKHTSRLYLFASLAAAACLAAVVYITAISTDKGLTEQEQLPMASITSEDYDSYEYDEDALNYTMVDNAEIYCYLEGGY